VRMKSLSRRLAVLVAAVVLLSVAVPSGQSFPNGPNRFPLAGLWEWITTRPAWAFERPLTPVQGRGGPVETAHAVGVEQTRANGGSGRARRDTAGTLP